MLFAQLLSSGQHSPSTHYQPLLQEMRWENYRNDKKMWVILGSVKHCGCSAGKEKLNIKNYLNKLLLNRVVPKTHLYFIMFLLFKTIADVG